MKRARYIMIGGFLGAGKSTALARLAQELHARGETVGLITNDQGSGLVDSASLRARGFAVEEIAGGCFCCRFGSLVDAARALSAARKPDVFLAEPVGSCTDLVATVSYPLRRIYGAEFEIAPLSVLVDPVRAARVLGLEDGRSFSRKVTYVYEKQLEEADFIVINKVDTLSAEETDRLRAALESRFPEARVFEVSARTGAGIESWFDAITTESVDLREAMEIDYDVYAEGEALLGWLNATIDVASSEPLDGNELLRGLADAVQERLDASDAEVAHLKMTLSPRPDVLGEIAVVNLVRRDFVPEVCQTLADAVEEGELILNLRAEGDPDDLRAAVEEAIRAGVPGAAESASPRLTIEHIECFRPGRPVPTHRLATPDGDPAGA